MAGWLKRWSGWRRARTLARRAIPDETWLDTLEHYPFLARRSTADLLRLRELATLFLARKEFSGAGGLTVTDEMAVAIAAQACLPVLELGLDCYDGFVGIVVHPEVVAAPRAVVDDDGVVHEYVEELAGEAVPGGPLMLAWSDVAEAGASAEWGYNVVVHEFVHVLDLHAARAGLVAAPDGGPWASRLGRLYDSFAARVDAGAETFLDPYGAEAVQEFFAVGAEAFFVAPDELRREESELYEVLAAFFRQRPGGPVTPRVRTRRSQRTSQAALGRAKGPLSS